MGQAVRGASQPPEQAPLPQETKAAPTRIEVTIPIPLDMYQGSGAAEGSRELWGQGGTEGTAEEPGLGTESLAGAGGTGHHKEGTSPLCARATEKEDSGAQQRDEDRDVDETAEQGLPSLGAPGQGSCPAAAQDTREEHDGEKKSRGVSRDSPGEALQAEAGEDQEEKAQLLGGEGAADLAEPSGSVSQKEAEPKEGEDAGPVLEAAQVPAEVEDDVKDRAAPLEEAGGRRTPRRKPGGLAADKASRVPLPKGVCSSCAGSSPSPHLGSCCLGMAGAVL